MADMAKIEQLVDSYVAAFPANELQSGSIYLDYGRAYDKLSIFKSFPVETFTHQELCKLSSLLTRTLKGAINVDHRTFWSWCALVVKRSSYTHGSTYGSIQLFKDRDWVEAFEGLVSLVLCARKYSLPPDRDWERKTLQYVNWHLLQLEYKTVLIAGPVAFAVLEGLLRRKNGKYVTKEGNVLTPFCITDSNGKQEKFSKRLNMIDDSLRLFDQLVVTDRGRPCPTLALLKKEIETHYPKLGDAFDMIGSWRCDLVHGSEYWSNRVPIILNMICLLAIDEFEPSVYDVSLPDFGRQLQWYKKVAEHDGYTTDVFPLDPG